MSLYNENNKRKVVDIPQDDEPSSKKLLVESAQDFLSKLVTEQKLQAPTLFSREEEKYESNGKLSFFLDGRFVLELVHTGKNNTSSGGWIQTKGTVWTPNVDVTSKHSTVCPLQNSSDVTKETVSKKRMAVVNFRIHQRRLVNVYHLRKAARNPTTHDLTKSDGWNKTVRLAHGFKKRKKIDDLFKLNLIKDVKKEEFLVSENNNLPLPEWYLDPSKSRVPISEMIGYPRPYLPAEIITKDRKFPISKNDDSLRELIIQDLLDGCANVDSRYVPPLLYSQVASKYKVNVTDITRLWSHYCITPKLNSHYKQDVDVKIKKEKTDTDEGPLDLRVDTSKNRTRNWLSKEEERNAFCVGLINYPTMQQMNSLNGWASCVTCPLVVNSYYYCCCFLPGSNCRCNCSCKSEKPVEHQQYLPNCHAGCSGSMLKDLLLKPSEQNGCSNSKSAPP